MAYEAMDGRGGYNFIIEMCSLELLLQEHVPASWQGHPSVPIILFLISLKWSVPSLSKMFSYLIFQGLKQVALIHMGLPVQYHAWNCQIKEFISQGAYKSKSNWQDKLRILTGWGKAIKWSKVGMLVCVSVCEDGIGENSYLGKFCFSLETKSVSH